MSIGLTLSGGGAKGAAHIGVLKALEEENIKISAISGTSSGSIVAALYTCGYKATDIYYIFKKYCKYITDYDHMIPFKVINTLFTGKVKLKSLAKGNNIECIMDTFARKKSIIDISECKLPLAIPAVDVVNGEIVYYLSRRINKRNIEDATSFDDRPSYIYGGRLSSIVRASTAFPGVFEPKRINSHLLIDGGTRVNSPVRILKDICESNEKIMVVYFEKSNNNTIPTNIIETTVKAVDIMGHEVNFEEINYADFKINVESSNVGLLDVSKINYMTRLGYNIAKDYIKKNRKLLE